MADKQNRDGQAFQHNVHAMDDREVEHYSMSMEELLECANRGLGLDSEKYGDWLREPNIPQVTP